MFEKLDKFSGKIAKKIHVVLMDVCLLKASILQILDWLCSCESQLTPDSNCIRIPFRAQIIVLIIVNYLSFDALHLIIHKAMFNHGCV